MIRRVAARNRVGRRLDTSGDWTFSCSCYYVSRDDLNWHRHGGFDDRIFICGKRMQCNDMPNDVVSSSSGISASSKYDAAPR